jgi:hypothetical protein
MVANPLNFRGNVAEAHVGPVVMVGPSPAGGKVGDFFDRFKQVMGKPVVAHGPVVALDICILLWLPWLDEIDANAALLRPCQGDGADVVGTVVAAIACGQPRHSMIRPCDRMTRPDDNEKSTSMPRPSRL